MNQHGMRVLPRSESPNQRRVRGTRNQRRVRMALQINVECAYGTRINAECACCLAVRVGGGRVRHKTSPAEALSSIGPHRRG